MWLTETQSQYHKVDCRRVVLELRNSSSKTSRRKSEFTYVTNITVIETIVVLKSTCVGMNMILTGRMDERSYYLEEIEYKKATGLGKGERGTNLGQICFLFFTSLDPEGHSLSL